MIDTHAQGFRRCTRLDNDKSANVNAGGGQAYLWYHRGPQRGAPVVAVDVIYNDEAVPAGFERVARDMCKGSSSRGSFLCFRRRRQPEGPGDEEAGPAEPAAEAEQEQPLAQVVLAAADETPGEGFVRLEKPLCKGDNPLYLCYKRVAPAGPPDAQPWSPATLKVGRKDHASEQGETSWSRLRMCPI